MPALEIHPLSYPLDHAAFRRALATGHGRAMIHAERHGLEDFRSDVIDACRKCLVLDPQSNGYREDWLASLCRIAGCVDEMISLGVPETDEDDKAQYERLLTAFHRQGNLGTVDLLKEIARRPETFLAELACWDLMEIQGEEGLVFAAATLGKRLSADPGYWVDAYLMPGFDEDHGDGRAREILSTAALGDPDIARYLEDIDSRPDSPTAFNRPVSRPLDQVMAMIRSGRSSDSWMLPSWGRRAGESDREEVMRLLYEVDLDPAVLANVLRFLAIPGLPRFDEKLLPLILHEDGDVRYWAARMFGKHADDRIRPLAFSALERGWVIEVVEALSLVARQEDTGFILAALDTRLWNDDHECHDLFSSILGLLEKGPRLRSPGLALAVYEFTPCMHCREKGLKLLLEWNECPEWVREEAAKDARESIRELLTGENGPPAQ